MRVPYEDVAAVNWSTLVHMRQSPAHYANALQHRRQDTPAFALGRAVHALVLEPHSFDQLFTVWADSRRTKAWKDFAAEEQRTILRTDDMDRARAIAAAVAVNPLAAEWLSRPGLREQEVYWVDTATQLPCKARLDYLCPERRWLADLKTCRSTDHRRFAAAAATYGYHGQLAHYAAAVRGVLGWAPARVAIIAVESDPPHDVVVYELDVEGALAAGEELRRALLERVAECMAAGSWPGRYDEPQVLELPAWALPDDDVDLDLLEAS